MADVTRRKVTTYRWICTDKDRCEQIDDAIESLVFHSSQLSHYVEHKEITGLECLVLDGKFKWALKELREERSRLWRRIPRVEEEETVSEGDGKPAEVEVLSKYESPFAPLNMERVL